MATADTCVLYNKELVFSLSEDSPEFTHEIIITNGRRWGWVRRADRVILDTRTDISCPCSDTSAHFTRITARRQWGAFERNGEAIYCSQFFEKLTVAQLFSSLKFIYVLKIAPPVSVQSIPTHRSFFEFHFNNILPSTCVFPICFFPLKLFAKMSCICIFHRIRATRLSHHTWWDHLERKHSRNMILKSIIKRKLRGC